MLSQAVCTLAVSYQAGKYISEATFLTVSIHNDLRFQSGHDARELDLFQRKLIQNNSSGTGVPNQEICQLTMKYLT